MNHNGTRTVEGMKVLNHVRHFDLDPRIEHGNALAVTEESIAIDLHLIVFNHDIVHAGLEPRDESAKAEEDRKEDVSLLGQTKLKVSQPVVDVAEDREAIGIDAKTDRQQGYGSEKEDQGPRSIPLEDKDVHIEHEGKGPN